MELLFFRLIVTMTAFSPTVQQKNLPATNEAKIRFLLKGEEGIDRGKLARLGGLSPAAFPFYTRILDDPKADRYIVARTLWVLTQIEGDRSRFLERAVAKLAESDHRVRRAAVALLAEIGTPRDEAPIVALLSDKEWTNAIAAAKALAAIGDRRALAAMDVWLATSTPHGDRNERFDVTFRQDIAKYRDQLKARLEKEEKEKPPGK